MTDDNRYAPPQAPLGDTPVDPAGAVKGERAAVLVNASLLGAYGALCAYTALRDRAEWQIVTIGALSLLGAGLLAGPTRWARYPLYPLAALLLVLNGIGLVQYLRVPAIQVLPVLQLAIGWTAALLPTLLALNCCRHANRLAQRARPPVR